MTEPTDMELIRRSATGDRPAFERLVDRHYDRVYRIAYKWCGRRQDAEDVSQEVFVKLARSVNTFGHRAAFRTWLYRVVINTAKDHWRKQATRKRYEQAFVQQQAADNPGPGPAPADATAALYRALGRLPDKQKAAVLLVLAEGLSHKEAAAVLRCRESTVSWRIFAARKKLQKELSPGI